MLPNAWVDEIFASLAVRYGAAWVSLWNGLDITAVKGDWARQLDGCSTGHIAHGLDSLPVDRPPNAAQFRALCLRKPAPVFQALPPPKADAECAARALASMRKTREAILNRRGGSL